MNKPHAPLAVRPAPDPVEPDLEPLLAEPFASSWALTPAQAITQPHMQPDVHPGDVRQRLLARLAESREASRPMHTARARRLPTHLLAPGVHERVLYAAQAALAPRAGEPRLARLLTFAPGSRWSGPPPDHHREWLVLQGALRLGALLLGPRDYHAQAAGSPAQGVASDDGALVFLRESPLVALNAHGVLTVRDSEAGWPDFAPGIQRRVLWQGSGQAALLYYAQAGARIPHHTHGHDEECLMMQGELFLDDVLLQAGDYQLAPAGTGHRLTETDTGVVLFAHGDLELNFVA